MKNPSKGLAKAPYIKGEYTGERGDERSEKAHDSNGKRSQTYIADSSSAYHGESHHHRHHQGFFRRHAIPLPKHGTAREKKKKIIQLSNYIEKKKKNYERALDNQTLL